MGISDRNEGDAIRNAVDWIREHVELRESTSAESLYDHMESQSGEQLSVIYVPFDAGIRGHFVDRGQIIDYAVLCGPGRVLDFGPGGRIRIRTTGSPSRRRREQRRVEGAGGT